MEDIYWEAQMSLKPELGKVGNDGSRPGWKVARG
jgi:hypothetical protein